MHWKQKVKFKTVDAVETKTSIKNKGNQRKSQQSGTVLLISRLLTPINGLINGFAGFCFSFIAPISGVVLKAPTERTLFGGWPIFAEEIRSIEGSNIQYCLARS